MRLRRRSRKSRLAGTVVAYLKLKAVGKALKGARKGMKGLAAYKATRTVAKRAPAPVKALPVVAGVGAAGAVAARRRRSKDGEPVAV